MQAEYIVSKHAWLRIYQRLGRLTFADVFDLLATSQLATQWEKRDCNIVHAPETVYRSAYWQGKLVVFVIRDNVVTTARTNCD